MGRWRAWFVSWQPGSAWPWLVTWQQVFLAAKTAVAAGLARVRQRWGNDPAQWLTVGLALAMSQRSWPRPAARSTRQHASPPDRRHRLSPPVWAGQGLAAGAWRRPGRRAIMLRCLTW